MGVNADSRSAGPDRILPPVTVDANGIHQPEVPVSAGFCFASRSAAGFVHAMGFLDRLTGKTDRLLSHLPVPKSPRSRPPRSTCPADPGSPTPGGIMPRLANAREKLEGKDLPGALVIYEEVLAARRSRRSRADVVLVTISDRRPSARTGMSSRSSRLVAPRMPMPRVTDRPRG